MDNSASFHLAIGRWAAIVMVFRPMHQRILAEEFYVNSPVCSPSRVAIYPDRWRIVLVTRREGGEYGFDESLTNFEGIGA